MQAASSVAPHSESQLRAMPAPSLCPRFTALGMASRPCPPEPSMALAARAVAPRESDMQPHPPRMAGRTSRATPSGGSSREGGKDAEDEEKRKKEREREQREKKKGGTKKSSSTTISKKKSKNALKKTSKK